MYGVAHFVCSKRAFDFFDDFFARRDFRERQLAGRTLQPVQMLVQLENMAVVQTQAFPDRVAALDCRIKRADSSLVAMHQLPVDVHDQIAISLIKFLQHWFRPITRIVWL